MKRFLVKSLLFVLPVLLFTYGVFRSAGEYTDEFYLRFTSPQQSSLILGTSRAAQGLDPDVLNKHLGRTDLYNYSFTVVHSPYGPVYLQSIKRKLDPQTKDGIFILTVDPWSISNPNEDPDDVSKFRDNELALGRVKFVNLDPNVFYLVDMYQHPFYKLFQGKGNGEIRLHTNGWLEISVPMDSATTQQRIKEKVAEYNKFHVPFYHFSEARFNSFRQTIDFLAEHGKVYLVRLPVHRELLSLENKLMPDFNDKINDVSRRHNVPYLDLTPASDRYLYTDGNHLYKGSGAEVSKEISDWIKKVSPEARP